MAKRKIKRMASGGTPDWMNEPGLEGVYPEEFLPVGRGIKALGSAAEKGLGVLDRIMRAKRTENKVVQPFGSMAAPGPREYAVRDLRGSGAQDELQDIMKSGRAMGPSGQKWWTGTSEEGSFGYANPNTTRIRTRLENVKQRGAVPRSKLEKFNPETSEFEPMKKGGKVKAKVSQASKRGDGIAQRGKTKGRFV